MALKPDLTGLDVLMTDALRRGLERADATMVRVANEILSKAEVDDALSSVEIDIVPYEIADTSLREIVLRAPERVIDEIVDALAERRRQAEFGGMGHDDG